MENLLLLGLVVSTTSSTLDVSLDPCLNGFNFPKVFPTDEKNVGFRAPPPLEEDGVPWFFFKSVTYIFIFVSSARNASFSLTNDTSACTWLLVVTAF